MYVALRSISAGGFLKMKEENKPTIEHSRPIAASARGNVIMLKLLELQLIAKSIEETIAPT